MDNQKKQQMVIRERNEQDTIDREITTFGDNVEGRNSNIGNNGRTQTGNWLDKHKLHLQMMKQKEDIKLKNEGINFKARHNIFDNVTDMIWPSHEQKLLDI